MRWPAEIVERIAMWFRANPEMRHFRTAASEHTAVLKTVRRDALISVVKASDPTAKLTLNRSTDALRRTINTTLDRL